MYETLYEVDDIRILNKAKLIICLVKIIKKHINYAVSWKAKFSIKPVHATGIKTSLFYIISTTPNSTSTSTFTTPNVSTYPAPNTTTSTYIVLNSEIV